MRAPRRNLSCDSLSSQGLSPTARSKTPPPIREGSPPKPGREPQLGRDHSSGVKATPAAGIILLRERPAVSELDDAAWESQELEVLIGRYHVVDALRSGRDRLVALRYGGEWHFPGGAKRQADRGPLQTACRELHEEFLGGAGDAAPELAATLFAKVSISVSSRPYVQYVFVADEADARCSWRLLGAFPEACEPSCRRTTARSS